LQNVQVENAAHCHQRLSLLQLLGGILDFSSKYVSVVDSLQLSHRFFEYLMLEHPNNNVHNIRLCRQLIVNGSLSHEQLVQLDAAAKVGVMCDCRTVQTKACQAMCCWMPGKAPRQVPS
jgi:hypothetical protein